MKESVKSWQKDSRHDWRKSYGCLFLFYTHNVLGTDSNKGWPLLINAGGTFFLGEPKVRGLTLIGVLPSLVWGEGRRRHVIKTPQGQGNFWQELLSCKILSSSATGISHYVPFVLNRRSPLKSRKGAPCRYSSVHKPFLWPNLPYYCTRIPLSWEGKF
jgi:hypothetical protein